MPNIARDAAQGRWLLLAFTTAAAAQDYPTKPVRLLIPFAPGGSVDIVAASSRRAAWRAARQAGVGRQPAGRQHHHRDRDCGELAPDGHTLLMISFTHAVTPWINKTPLRFPPRLHPDHHPRQGRQRADRAPLGAGQFGEGADRARQEQAEATAVRERRDRQLHPRLVRPVRDDGRHRGRARAVQGQRPGDDRRDRRPHPGRC